MDDKKRLKGVSGCKDRLYCKDGGYGTSNLSTFLCGMKPIKNSIPIRELQTLLRQWRRKGLKETTLLKVLELYLGLPNYMNEQGVYPVHHFYDLSVTLKFRTVISMMEAVKLTGSFGWTPGDNKVNVACFYSPLWKEISTDVPAKMPADLPANVQVENNISNNINHLSSPPEINPSEEGRKFFHEINENPAEKAEVLQPLIVWFQQQEPGLTREEACADVVHLVNELLIPHFIAQEKFLRMKHNGRLAWLKNLLKTVHGRELMKKAAEAGKQRRLQQKQQALAEVKQKNRPLSPYEWTDPTSGIRFYEDSVEGVVTIPKEAPPRPSEDCFWNVIQQCWM